MTAIRAFIAQDKPRAAAKWAKALRHQWESLGKNPHRYEVFDTVDGIPYRHVIYGIHRIIYRIEEQVVHVVRVVHAAQEFRPGPA